MRTLDTTAITPELQEELLCYGVVVESAKKKAPVNIKKPNFFGIRDKGTEPELIFKPSKKDIEGNGVQIAVLAPEIEPFDMLLTQDFPKAVKETDPKTMREYLNRLFDEIKL